MVTLSSAARVDLTFAETLTRQATQHDAAAIQCRRDRRAVWLRLHEEHGLRHEDLVKMTGYGATTIWKELRAARTERDI